MKSTSERNRKPSPILVVEDDAAVRQLIESILGGAGYETRGAASAEEALEVSRRERPLLALLDVRLPGLSGYEVCRWLRSNYGQSVPVVFVSGERTEAFDRAAGLMLGADDYVVKPFAAEELLWRVRAVLQRVTLAPGALALKLTPRETEVLRLLAMGDRQDDIARRLVISPKTVGTHIEHIYTKLGVQSRAQAIALAFRERLIEAPPVEPSQPAAAAASERRSGVLSPSG